MSWPVGRTPGGPRAYHTVTAGLLGSQAFHPPKLARAWARYAELLRDPCGVEVEGLRVWVHECGWTPVSGLASYLLTGRGATLTNSHAWVLDRYVAPSLEAVLGMDLPEDGRMRRRREVLRELGPDRRARCILSATGGRILDDIDPARVPLGDASMDLCHSGNALEHYTLEGLRAFLRECWRVLRPGGIASHVVDHRDHLHHVDRSWPFLAHLALPDRPYSALFGHPLLRHNRLSPTEVMDLFGEAGFEPVAVRRASADGQYASDAQVMHAPPGLPNWLRRGRARRWSELDLRTAYAHYLYRKPSSGAEGA